MINNFYNREGYKNDMDYFEKIVATYKCNDWQTSKIMYGRLPKGEKLKFLNAALGNWKTGLEAADIGRIMQP